MADVTISQLTQGTPSSSSLIPYSTGSSTLGAPVSAMFQNTNAVSIGGIASGVVTPVPSRLAIVGSGALNPTSYMSLSSCLLLCNNSQNSGSNDVPDTTTGSTVAILGGSGLVSGIGFTREAQSTWGTQIRFYTHAPSTLIPTDSIVERMRIDSNGIVTKPYQPIFRVSMTGGGGNQAAFIKVPFNYATVNVGGHYSLTDKQFNVPVDGNYHFTAGHMNSQNNSGVGTIEIRKNDVRQCYFHNSNSHPMSTSWSIILQCSKGDYINMYASHYHFGGAAESGYDYPTLMGYLIG